MVNLVHELIFNAANRNGGQEALVYHQQRINYADLAANIDTIAHALLAMGLGRGERVAVYLDKRLETVCALFGTAAAGGIFVPVNPLLKSKQLVHILTDCNVKMLVTSGDRLSLITSNLSNCPDLHTVIVAGTIDQLPVIPGLTIVPWDDLTETKSLTKKAPIIDSDAAAILYTSGSTGKPKGVVLSHRNLVVGAKSVCQYLENDPNDRILAVLPLSFDYGLSQLTTTFYAGATAVLLNYLLPRDIISAVGEENITGLAAVPHLWMQLAELDWSIATSLRFITSSGGTMPPATLKSLRSALPRTKIFLMYGLTEAFRSTFLPPEEVDSRPDSIGKAIPNAEVLVLREDGSHCAPDEPGELVHRGSLVSLGYWNNPQQTAACFRPLPTQLPGLTIPELAVWSGDTVRMDEAGYLYFLGRRDEMIKTAGYRISPTEVEEVIYGIDGIAEAVVIGVPHPKLGQGIVAVVTLRNGFDRNAESLMAICKRHLPAFMLPGYFNIRNGKLPRNTNGKIDRKTLACELQHTFMESSL